MKTRILSLFLAAALAASLFAVPAAAADNTAEVTEEAVAETASDGLEADAVVSDAQIGDAITVEDLASGIASYAASTSSYYTIKVTGTANYSYAYQVLNLVNEERAAAGLSSLTMDADLLDAAMQRAAETSIYWSHTRPSGESCFTVSSKISGENIACGSSSLGPTYIMNAWMNSSGHRANILGSTYKSIGIGVFVKDGYIYWTQEFGTSSGTSVSKSGSSSKTYSVEVSPNTVSTSLTLSASKTTLTVGNSTTLTVKIKNPEVSVNTTIENTSLTWSSSNTSVATVSSSGKVTAVGKGTTKITGKTSGGQLSASISITCAAGEVKKASDGNWYYYVNGKKDTSYTGFATNSNGKWYVESGKVTKKKNGVLKDKTGAIGNAGVWYYVEGSKVKTGFTGLSHYKNSSGWWYITNGKVDRSYNGLAKNQNGWFYVKKGKVDRSYTGFATNSKGKWYVSKGKVTKRQNGVLKDKTGVLGTKNAWYYVTGSKVQTKFTGLANYKNSSGWWYITNGKVDRSFTGIATNKNGTYYVKNGKVQQSYSGQVTYNGRTYEVTQGKVN